MAYGESNDHMTDNIRRPENVKIVSQIYLYANILKRQEIQDQFQWTTSRNSEVLSSLFLTSKTRVDINHDSQHDSILSENATGDEVKSSQVK